MSVVPSFLKRGDTILIIGTARIRSKEQIQPAVEILKSWGLRVITGKNLYKKHNQFAGTDEERAKDLQWAIDHPTAKAVLLSGGGYGTLRIIDLVNFKPLKKNPKWFAGYSDATIIHSRLINAGICCIHSTMAFQFGVNKKATASLRQVLFGEKINYTLKKNKLNRVGKGEGKLVGGNLSILYALSGSVDEISTKNKVLFIEDLDEQLYHIDRMMLQLKRSGKLKNLAGLVVGGMSEMKDNAVPFGKTAEEIILDAVKDYNYPVCFNFPAGHISLNMAFLLGKKVSLDVKQSSANLTYL
jgi:muramoyltetrapeptide carboxypeptidase